MKVIMVMVVSLNGKITRGDDPNIYQWTSKEDQDYFYSLLKKNKAMIMGSTTYDVAKKNIRLTKDRLKIVLTKTPEKYLHDEVKGQLEFTDESPEELVRRLKKTGYKKLLLLGGGRINASFLKGNLVDEFYLTLEPIIFGSGKALVDEGEFGISLKLLSQKKLNNKGTLLLKYQVLKNTRI